MEKNILIGPFKQLLPFTDLPLKGPINDDQLTIVSNAGILIKDGKISKVATYENLLKSTEKEEVHHVELTQDAVALPGLIDAHTHICFAGSRAEDYAIRNSGGTYLEIAAKGGGIWQTVKNTREATQQELVNGIVNRAREHMKNGITTIEVKSGYGLSPVEELKMLKAIQEADSILDINLIATCLAAHIPPKEYRENGDAYLELLCEELLPAVKSSGLSNRVDIFIESGAFTYEQGLKYLNRANELGFNLTVHADQFSVGGSALAVETSALSADHLEASGDKEIALLAKSDVTGIALPGASMGLGVAFAPARALLDAGGALAIASDHNPGSAPMGQLITQAAVLGSYEKLTNAEVLSGLTFRAAKALGLSDCGKLAEGFLGDMVVYETEDYREILYHQGSLKPTAVFKKGKQQYNGRSEV